MTTYLFLYFLVGVVAFIVVNRTLVDDEDFEDVVFIGLMAIFAWPLFIACAIMGSVVWLAHSAGDLIRNYKR